MFISAGDTVHQLPKARLPELAIVGKSNVGKSSLVNNIFGQHALARVSKTPGRTQQIILFQKNNIVFADLPGFGFAKVSKLLQKTWPQNLHDYFMLREKLRLIYFLWDPRRDMDKSDMELLLFLQSKFTVFIILTKIDKYPKHEIPFIKDHISAVTKTPLAHIFAISNTHKIGFTDLWSKTQDILKT
jgi:GTP-binding protein